MTINLTAEEVKEIAENAAKEAITKLLNPIVEIVTSNPVPKYATPGDAGVDLQADLWNVQEKFMKKCEVWRTSDFLNFDLQTAMDRGDSDAVEAIQKALSEIKEDVIEGIYMYPGGHCLVPTGIYVSFPEIYEMQVRPRSGLALKSRITMTNSPGTIDANYRNEIGLILDNEDDKPFIIRHGDRIAQAVFAIKCTANFVQKETVSELSGPNRGGGFGSTGV